MAKEPLKLIDTADQVELFWKDEISKSFPSYEVLWSEFIGTRWDTSARRLKPYWIRFRPEKKYAENQEKGYLDDPGKYEMWEEVCNKHYNIFTSLAGALYHREKFSVAYKIYKDEAEEMTLRRGNYFVFREEFDCFYTRLQSTVEFVKGFGKDTLRWIGAMKSVYSTKSILEYTGRSVDKKSHEEIKQLEENLKQTVEEYRHFTLHIGRLPTSIEEEGLVIPTVLKDDKQEYKSAIDMLEEGEDKKWTGELMHTKIEKDLEMVFKYADLTDKIVLELLKDLKEKGFVQIDYESGQTGQEIETQLKGPLSSSTAIRLTGTAVEHVVNSSKNLLASGDQFRR